MMLINRFVPEKRKGARTRVRSAFLRNLTTNSFHVFIVVVFHIFSTNLNLPQSVCFFLKVKGKLVCFSFYGNFIIF